MPADGAQIGFEHGVWQIRKRPHCPPLIATKPLLAPRNYRQAEAGTIGLVFCSFADRTSV